MAKAKTVVFYALTESGDQYLAVLPKKLNSKDFAAYCRDHYPDEFYDGNDTLNGRQIELAEGQGIQL